MDTEARWRAELAAEVTLRQKAEAEVMDARAQQGAYAAELGTTILAMAKAQAVATALQAERDSQTIRETDLQGRITALTRENELIAHRATQNLAPAPTPGPDMSFIEKKLVTIGEDLARARSRPDGKPIEFDLNVERDELGRFNKFHIIEKR